MPRVPSVARAVGKRKRAAAGLAPSRADHRLRLRDLPGRRREWRDVAGRDGRRLVGHRIPPADARASSGYVLTKWPVRKKCLAPARAEGSRARSSPRPHCRPHRRSGRRRVARVQTNELTRDARGGSASIMRRRQAQAAPSHAEQAERIPPQAVRPAARRRIRRRRAHRRAAAGRAPAQTPCVRVHPQRDELLFGRRTGQHVAVRHPTHRESLRTGCRRSSGSRS